MLSSPGLHVRPRTVFSISICLALVAVGSLWLLGERARAAVVSHTSRSVASVPANSVLTPAGSTITVNSTADIASDDGLCTLREAITAANSDTASGVSAGECVAGSGDDTIDLTSLTTTISLISGELLINQNVTIQGPGANVLTVSGNNASRVFNVQFGTTVTITDLTVANGKTALTSNGAGILNSGTLTLTNCNFYGNSGNNLGGAIYHSGPLLTLSNCNIGGAAAAQANTATGGAGIFNGGIGAVSIMNSTFSNNSAIRFGGAIDNSTSGTITITNSTLAGNSSEEVGGGIANESGGTVTITGSSLNNNFATVGGRGGAVYNKLGTININNSTLSGNSGPSGGGGILTNGNSNVNIANSTLNNNSAGSGGAIYSLPNSSSGTINITNSTLSGNSATDSNGNGGAIFNNANAKMNLTNCTVSNNSAPIGSGIVNNNSGAGGFKLTNTIVAGNLGPELLGTFTSQGHNFIGRNDGSTGFVNGVNGDIVGTNAAPINPLLGPLQNNGGPTQTHALLAISPAIDAGDNCVTQATHCGDANVPQLTTDQRGAGFIRADDGNGAGSATVDMGAYEVQSILVTNTLDSGAGSLRDAITSANLNPDTNAINFQAGLVSPITLLSALPNLSTSMSINGPGASQMTVQRSSGAGTNFSIFKSSPNAVIKISGLTIANGNQGGIFNDAGTFTIESCVLTGHSGGPAIKNGFMSGGTITINNSTISNNTAGGIDNSINAGSALPPVILTINNSTISGNSSAGLFGGIQNVVGSNGVAKATINNSTISGNTSGAGGGAGGIFNFVTLGGTATLVVNVSTIYGNNSNDASGTGGIEQHVDCGGFGAGCVSTVRLLSTIVTGNLRSGSSPNDVSGTLDPASAFNLIGTGGSGGLTNGTNGNQVGVANPGLGPLANNGGPTQTHGLLLGSPAIDQGDNCVATNSCLPSLGSAIATDQRGTGFKRSADGLGTGTPRVDIGAYEIQSYVVTNTADSGAGSLRQAITDANANPDTNAINFQLGLTGTITLSSALPAVSTSTSINGPGANVLTVRRSSVGGTPDFRIFTINSGSTVTISGLTISNGNVPGSDGGGIRNGGTLTLTNCNFFGNNATGGGGGVSNASGSLTLIGCNIGGTLAGQANTANAGNGGGLLNSTGSLTMTGGSIVGNSGGGFVASFGAAATLRNVAIANNTSSTEGGGIGMAPFGAVNIINCLIASNTAGTTGGGIFNNGGTLTVVNSTISGNTASGSGGGISHPSGPFGGTITLTNVTVTNNRSDSDNSGGEQGGGISRAAGTVTLKNAIVAGNFRGASPGTTADDISGAIDINSSFNLIGTGGTGGLTNANNNQVGVTNPLVGPLANNGGPTMTQALLPGSPAINAGGNANLPADTFDLDGDTNTAEPLPVDQRGAGFARVVNTTVDIGAFESRGFTMAATGGTPQSATITTAFGSSLVATVSSAFGEPVGGGVVTLTAPASGASGSFPGSVIVTQVATNGSGVATSPTLTANGTPGGPYNVVASGNGISSAALFSLTNTQAATSTSITSSANPSDFGQSVTFTATVTSGIGTPTGSIQFKDGGANLGSPQALNVSGVATFSTSSMTAGSHTITADYGGAANFVASSGALASAQVVKEPPSLAINDVSISEGDSGTKSLTFAVTLSAATSQTVTVNYATADGTAAAGSDYQAANGTVTFNPGDLTKPIAVTINGDQRFEPNENFVINLSSPAIASISDSQGVGTILNDDAQGGIISFNQASYSVGESDGGLTITVNRSGDTSAAATVDYATSDAGAPCSNPNHLASAKCDFTTTLGTLHFAVGERSKTFTILINQDSFVEGAETFTVSLSKLTGGAVLGATATATVTITDDASEPTTNAIDDASNFVRQNYHDFLNREPDASGLAFWTNQITSCGSDQACIETKRINVSAAFFLSIEFQETGYLVERMYKTAYGDASGGSTFGGAHSLPVPIVRFNEFLPDTQQIGQGVVVGQTGWEGDLANNKQAFTAEFVQRARFVTAYPLSMTPGQFVDQLNTRAGNVLSPGERATAIGLFGGAANTSNLTARAQALRQVAEDPDLNAAESNRAFVLMQFFGFLRRNPNDPQDTDYTGYDFWLTKLNEFNGNFVNAEMVKAFITSSEYRQRFGP